MPKVKQTHGKDSIYVSEASSHLKKNPDFRWSLVKDNFITEEECELLKEHIYESCMNPKLDKRKKNKEVWDKY